MADQPGLFAERREYDARGHRFRSVLVAPVETPASRRDDPETSRTAEIEITASGDREAQQRAVVALVQMHPGATARELALIAAPGLPADATARYYAIQRRVSELSPQYVRRGDARLCRLSHRSATTLWPAEEGR